MDPEIESVEARVKSFMDQLKVEYGILDRMVYKNKNQHRRSSYFQYLLKVRRDLRLLQSARLEDILNSSFLVIHGKRAKQKVQLLESLKRRKCDGKHSFLERLLGAARLLSQIIEPMMKAATEISILLARSFFMGFSVTVMALLARLRVLLQQILLDVVSVFNMVSSLSRKEQSVKLTQDGLEVYRDLYPANEQAVVYLECVWKADKFVLSESISEPVNKNKDVDLIDVSPGEPTVQYQCIEALLGDEPVKVDPSITSGQGPSDMKGNNLSLLEGSTNKTDVGELDGDATKIQSCSGVTEIHSNNRLSEGAMLKHSPVWSDPVKLEPVSRKKVAFVSVKMPIPSTGDAVVFSVKNIESCSVNKEDPSFCLNADGNQKKNLL